MEYTCLYIITFASIIYIAKNVRKLFKNKKPELTVIIMKGQTNDSKTRKKTKR